MSKLSQWLRSFGRPPESSAPTRSWPQFSLETEADAKVLQQHLTDLGYLDPGADGKWGGVSERMLHTLCKDNGFIDYQLEGIRAGDPLPPSVVDVLQNAKPLPLKPAAEPFLERVIKAMLAKGFWIARHPSCYNIVTVEGHDADGTPNRDERNVYNDVKLVFVVTEDGTPVVDGRFVCTTTPSIYWTVNPMNPAGAFNIAPGQQKCWALGNYKGVQALRQVEPIKGYRDRDRRGIRDLRYPVEGLFGVHHHHGASNKEDMGRSSAGCQVICGTSKHEDFIEIALDDARFEANNGYRFMATVLEQKDVV